MMTSVQWYYRVGERECGPVATEELRFLHQSGAISDSTLIRADGSSDWESLRQSGLVVTNGKRNSKIEGRFSPSAPFQHVPAGKRKLDVPHANEPEISPRPLAPMFPAIPSVRRDQNAPLILLGSFLGLLMLLVLAWLFWPDSSSSTGMASSGTGEGAADSGSDQSANETPANGAADSSEMPETPASAEVATSSSGDDADAAATNSEGTNPAEAPSSETGSGSSEATSDAKSDSTVAVDAAETDQPLGIEAEEMDAAETGLAVGDADGSRFSISAPGETTFFGIRGAGRRFTYVVDCSGSMQGEPLSRAKQELLVSISKLPAHVEFRIVFFDDLTYEFPNGSAFAHVSGKSKEQAKHFILGISGGGGTNVKLGVQKSLSLREKPDTIFLLTDGSFDYDTPAYITSLNKGKKVRVNTVAFVSNAGESLLKTIADENRGDYRYVP